MKFESMAARRRRNVALHELNEGDYVISGSQGGGEAMMFYRPPGVDMVSTRHR